MPETIRVACNKASYDGGWLCWTREGKQVFGSVNESVRVVEWQTFMWEALQIQYEQ